VVKLPKTSDLVIFRKKEASLICQKKKDVITLSMNRQNTYAYRKGKVIGMFALHVGK
jgi:hypothetical protein